MSLRVALRHRFPGAGAGLELALALDAPTPGVTALFGPSGSGKSSLVAAVAGLLRPGECRVEVDGAVLADTARGVWVPPERRRLGLVFQDARLFPHLRVEGNLRYGLRRAPPGPIRFEEVVELLGLVPLLRRRPHTLSGGERQRVAIGRALLAQPRLLLMDEPLASLDAARRAEILPFLARLRDRLRLPVLYVTHALEEVVRLADTLALVEAGRVVACGPVAAITARGDRALALRDDAGAVLDARVDGHEAGRGLTRLDASGATVWVPLLPAARGTALRIRVPAREVVLAREVPAAISMQNAVPGTVRAVTADPARRAALVEVAGPGDGPGDGSGDGPGEGPVLLARITPDAVARLALRPGTPVVALFKSVGVELFGDVQGPPCSRYSP